MTRTCRRCGAELEAGARWTLCSSCDQDLRQQEAERCSPERRALGAGVPRATLRCAWDGFRAEDQEAIRAIRAWRGSPPLLVVAGPTGVGKSVAAGLLVRDELAAGRPARFRVWGDLLDDLRAAEGRGEGVAAFRRIADYDGVLVLDDVGAARATPWAADRLLAALDRRLRYERATLVSTNLPPGRWSELGDERIASRLAGGLVVEWRASDRRRTANVGSAEPEATARRGRAG